jgi:hypothetical protein
MSTNLGTLGFHFDGRPCRVGCSYCYLGARPGSEDLELAPSLAAEIVASAPARDVAVAISEPAEKWRAGLEAVAAAAAVRGLPLAITTTLAVALRDPWVHASASRLTISVDPEKGTVDTERLVDAAARLRRPGLEIVALVSLTSPAFCERLAGGILADLLDGDAPIFDVIGLNGLKPPPPWCDRAFWLRFLGSIRPLLDRHLNRRLHLDCYVNARILGLGACPAKPDVTAGREFRACVYQAKADYTFVDAADLTRRTRDYVPPASCPFPIL